MSTRTPAPRVTNPHPNSLASLLSSWHLTDSPVKVENWRTKKPGGPAKSTSGPEQVLRKKDQPRCFIFDRHLVPSTWASFTSFLERNALPPYYADSSLVSPAGQDFHIQINFLRSLWQTEPVTDYSEDSFKWSELRSIPVAWVESLDLVLPPELRAGRAAQEGQRPFRKRQRDSQGVEVLYTTRADGVFYKEGSVLIVVEDKHARASWPPDEYVPLLEEEEEEGQEEEDGIFRRLLDYFLDKGPILTAREFYDLTRRGDPHVFSLLTKAIVSCTSRSARYFVLEDPLRAIFGALVPVNDPHEEIGKGDFDVVLSTMLPLTSSSPPFPQFVSSLYYNGETIRKLHSERAATLIVKHDRQADVEAESSRAPVAAAGRITRSMAGVGYEIAPTAGPSGRQASNLTILSESPTFLLVYPDGATPANPLLRRISSAGDDSLPTSDTSFGSEEDGHRAYSSDSHDAPPSPPRPKHELSPFPPTKTSTSENDEKPVILQIFDWIGLGTTSYAYEARTVGEKPTRYVIKVARRGRDPEEDAASFLCEAAILERLKDVEWVCHTYAYLEGADPKCRSVLLMEFGGEAIEKWEDLSRGERLELYQNVVTLHTEYGLAHNDLRPPNVVVDPPPSETTTTPTAHHKRRVRLIDFVWASEHECEGEAACEELLVFRRALGL
ncbi:hypothetical protein Rt10032_c18g6095 [Rhodotorula toruloides]|uniref:Protein kinase domain-containing protein n=1 Tax=Rhodotorula toruloides TaxID=5286 RepID=A0A511KNW5_RHOTO|nr:hypothetical protein Rt10032_c18g6095 [Rhodotorula toruloides]